MKKVLIIICCALLIPVMIAGCGEKIDENGDAALEAAAPALVESAPEPEPIKELTPVEVGKKVGAIYTDAMTEVTELIKDKPDMAEVKPKVIELKEKYVQELVELGKKRAAFPSEKHGAINVEISIAMRAVPQELFKAYGEAQHHYRKLDREFGNLISSFNIITQYADFELLKKQTPDEAKRLGIE